MAFSLSSCEKRNSRPLRTCASYGFGLLSAGDGEGVDTAIAIAITDRNATPHRAIAKLRSDAVSATDAEYGIGRFCKGNRSWQFSLRSVDDQFPVCDREATLDTNAFPASAIRGRFSFAAARDRNISA